jgi:crossover junction endodeoxyribonuclease RuvC
VEKEERIILGIDPGTTIMGYGIIQVKNKHISLVVMDVLKFDRQKNQLEKLKDIYEKVNLLIEEYHPDNVAIEVPFFGKSVQSMLKLARAQGVAIAAAMCNNIPVSEYSPRKIKMAITGKGGASKVQVAAMLHHLLEFEEDQKYLDATDAIAIAVCHHIQYEFPVSDKTYSGWDAFLSKNSDRIIRQ